MTLEEAIKHAEKVAEREHNNAQVYDKVKNDNLYHPDKITCEQAAKKCRECAVEHRQLAEWLKELKELRERSASETNDGDMLSRQSLIYSFKYDDNGEPWSIDDVIYRLKQFPSVREEQLDAGDTIYRQAAIARMTSTNDDEMQIVRHGYWIPDNCRPKSTLYRCSVCGEIAHDRPYGALKREPKKYCKMRYCPHCGAKMEVDCNA